MLIPLALAALLIFFLFNSRRKQKARVEQIKNGLVPGASVMTTFGVYGTVIAIDEENNQVTVESGPGTVLRVHRQAIGQIEAPKTAEAPVADAPAADADVDADAPAITDAELDAMNERKRAATQGAADDAEATDDAKAESTEPEAASDDAAADSAEATSESTDDDTKN